MRPSLNPSIHDASHSDADIWGTRFNEEGVAHVVPKYGKPHELSMSCWCRPVVDNAYSEPAISHNIAQ